MSRLKDICYLCPTSETCSFSSAVLCDLWMLEQILGVTSKIEMGQTALNVSVHEFGLTKDTISSNYPKNNN